MTAKRSNAPSISRPSSTPLRCGPIARWKMSKSSISEPWSNPLRKSNEHPPERHEIRHAPAGKRLEDERLITGRGRYTDDRESDGALWLYILRSPHAHARI